MALIYLFDARPDAYVAFEHDPIAEEVTDVVFENVGTVDYVIGYTWKNNQNSTFNLDAGTPETTIGIPPGLRKFLPITSGPKTGGHDSQLRSFGVKRPRQ